MLISDNEGRLKSIMFCRSPGCRRTSSGNPLPTDCNACLYLKRVDNGECVETCPEGYKKKDDTCVPSEFFQTGLSFPS